MPLIRSNDHLRLHLLPLQLAADTVLSHDHSTVSVITDSVTDAAAAADVVVVVANGNDEDVRDAG